MEEAYCWFSPPASVSMRPEDIVALLKCFASVGVISDKRMIQK